MQCWQCAVEIDAPICAACGSLQAPDPTLTHFERLNLSQAFVQDDDEIMRHHHAQQRLFHPDRFAGRNKRDRRHALQHATALNDAARALRDPAKRAEYLLRLAGRELDAEGEGRIQIEPSFLMEIIELREAIGELAGIDAHVERRQVSCSVAGQYETLLSQLGRGLDAAHWPPPSILLDGLIQQAAQLRYFRRILDELEDMEDDGL